MCIPSGIRQEKADTTPLLPTVPPIWENDSGLSNRKLPQGALGAPQGAVIVGPATEEAHP